MRISKMSTTQLLVLAAVAALMIAATTVVAATSPQAFASDGVIINIDSTSGQQNTGDTAADGGNSVGGEQNATSP
jgi:hypothetical protein